MSAPKGEASGSISAGHVSMMNDVLISQLPPDVLRGTLRTLLGASHANATVFTSTIKSYLSAHAPHDPIPSELYPSQRGSQQAVEPSQCLLETIRDARIHLSAHILEPALKLFHSVVFGTLAHHIAVQDVRSDPLSSTLVHAAGDMVQACQALKESGDRSKEVERALYDLISVLQHYHQYVAEQESSTSNFDPFERALAQGIDTYNLCFPLQAKAPAMLQMPANETMYSIKKAKQTLSTIKMGPLEVPRLFYGLWQLSSPAWGAASLGEITAAMSKLASLGFIAADMADHYADAEIIFGNFRNHIMFPSMRSALTCATKYCQFAPVPPNEEVDYAWVLGKVQERSNRIGGVVDLLQVHWQHLADQRYLDVFVHLIQISKDNPDLLRAVGLCNFDTKTTIEVCEHLKKTLGEVGIVSNQVQYSLIDHRPRYGMAEACKKYGIKLITYGTFGGGFLSDRWIGSPEPNVYAEGFNTSQRKYLDMIKAWGGWTLFQRLLLVLQGTAQQYGVSVSNVAARWVLDQPETGVVIIGSRLGVTSHDEANLAIDSFTLSDKDMDSIEAILKQSRGKQMFEQIGDCGQEYR